MTLMLFMVPKWWVGGAYGFCAGEAEDASRQQLSGGSARKRWQISVVTRAFSPAGDSD